MASCWEPLFVGRAAQPYVDVIDTIVDAVDLTEVEDDDWGRPLLHTYLSEARGSIAHRRRAKELVDIAIDRLARRGMYLGLYGGVAGVGWLSAHTDRVLGHGADDEAYDEIDESLLSVCRDARPPFVYDLISGLVGMGVYFLERGSSAKGVEAMKHIVEALEKGSEIDGDWITWHTPSEQLPEWQRARAPSGYYNLGVAHGVPGIIGLLAEMRRGNAWDQRAERLLHGAIGWVLDQRLPNGLLPSWTAQGVNRTSSRVAWCYGELGAAVVLLSAARAMGDSLLEKKALDTAVLSSRRRDDAGAMDAGLCHGAAGNAHLFNRLFQATHRSEFRDAAAYWFQRTLGFRVKGLGVAGYRAWIGSSHGETPTEPWRDDPSFLSGASGVALALLAATSSLEPNWDRVLLSSIRPL